MSSSAVMNALLTNVLMGGLLYGVNVFVKVTNDEQVKITGVAILTIITIAALFAFVWKWNTIRTWTFYLVVIPMFLTSTFDVLATLDTWLMRNGIFLKEYFQAHDLHLHSIVVTAFVFLDGTILQAINLIAIYKMSRGRSARSLLLVPAMSLAFLISVYAICILSTDLPLHPLTVSFIPSILYYLVIIPLGVLRLPRNYTLSPKNSTSWREKRTSGHYSIERSANISRRCGKNDSVHTNPFLWEVAVANFAFLLTGQFIFIVGSFYWKTPDDLRVDPANVVFWIINLIPVIACLAQIDSFSVYKFSLISKNPKVTKRS
ncbi:unnamed protein product [Allacma fusca]|uniref:Uncharacterized protein n=1 Tax=Allacma fusca TaxID=39272 RepID=A0A8J2P0J6_9HEXA|nr:unnamed protein product [Allacma fusca]